MEICSQTCRKKWYKRKAVKAGVLPLWLRPAREWGAHCPEKIGTEFTSGKKRPEAFEFQRRPLVLATGFPLVVFDPLNE